MTDIHVQPGGEAYERWAKNRLTALGQVRANTGLPAMRKQYVPEDGVRVYIESSDYGDRIRVFCDKDFGHGFASRDGGPLGIPSTISVKGKPLKFLDHNGTIHVVGSFYTPSKAKPHHGLVAFAADGYRLYYNGVYQSVHPLEYSGVSAFSLAGDKYLYWKTPTNSAAYALAIPVANREVFATDQPAQITNWDPLAIPAFASFLSSIGAATWANSYASLNDQTMVDTWSTTKSQLSGPGVNTGLEVVMNIDQWKARKATLVATVCPVAMSPDANDGTTLSMNATFTVATGILEIDFEAGTQTLTIVREDPIVVAFQAAVAVTLSTSFVVPPGRRTGLYLQDFGVHSASLFQSPGNSVAIASDGSSVVLIGKRHSDNYTTTFLASSDVYWRGAVRGVTLTNASPPFICRLPVVDAADKLSFIYNPGADTVWYYDGVSTLLRSGSADDAYLTRTCLSKDGQNALAAVRLAALPVNNQPHRLYWYRRDGTSFTLNITDRVIANSSVILNTNYSKDDAFFISYYTDTGETFVAPVTLVTDPDTLVTSVFIGAGIKQIGPHGLPDQRITPFDSIPAT